MGITAMGRFGEKTNGDRDTILNSACYRAFRKYAILFFPHFVKLVGQLFDARAMNHY